VIIALIRIDFHDTPGGKLRPARLSFLTQAMTISLPLPLHPASDCLISMYRFTNGAKPV
jgi:hypothetical protein